MNIGDKVKTKKNSLWQGSQGIIKDIYIADNKTYILISFESETIFGKECYVEMSSIEKSL